MLALGDEQVHIRITGGDAHSVDRDQLVGGIIMRERCLFHRVDGVGVERQTARAMQRLE